MRASFVITTHSARADVTRQALRLLAVREAGLLADSEVVLVSQDRVFDLGPGTPAVTWLALGMAEYSKPRLLNAGVGLAAGDPVVHIDGDRVMPAGYFAAVVDGWAAGRIVAPSRHFRLARPYSDEEIAAGAVDLIPDHRDTAHGTFAKCGFSGNVVFGWDDYWRAGGMDERFSGYGCNDTDMCLAAEAAGLRFSWTDAAEWHLWHEAGMSAADYRAYNERGALQVCWKWGVPPARVQSARFRSLIARDPGLVMF